MSPTQFHLNSNKVKRHLIRINHRNSIKLCKESHFIFINLHTLMSISPNWTLPKCAFTTKKVIKEIPFSWYHSFRCSLMKTMMIMMSLESNNEWMSISVRVVNLSFYMWFSFRGGWCIHIYGVHQHKKLHTNEKMVKWNGINALRFFCN